MVAEGDQRSTKREGDDEPESDRGDFKKLKTDENEEVGQEKKNATTVKIFAEYAKSERSSCKKCSEKIESKSIRLGLSSWDPREFETTKWHHIDCFFPLDADLASAESIEGFSDLKSSDQEKLKKLVSGVDQSSREVSSSDNPSSPQPTTQSSVDSSSPQHTPFPSFAQCASQQPYFPQQAFPRPYFPQQAFPQPCFPQQAFPQPYFPQQAFPQPCFPQQAFPQPYFPQQAFAQQPFPQPYIPQQSFQMNQYAFNQMAIFQLQQQYPFGNFGALSNTSQQPQTPQPPQTTQPPNSLSQTKSSLKEMVQEELRQDCAKKVDLIATQIKFKELKLDMTSSLPKIDTRDGDDEPESDRGDLKKLKRDGDDEPESDRGDLKKLKTNEDEEAGQEKKNATTVKILAEYAKSERSSCKKCSEKIESKSIRLGLSSWDPRGFETTKWHHIDCFFPLDADLASAESIEGFSDLKSSDQEKLKKLVSGVDQSSREVLFTGNLSISSSDSPSSPQPTTPSSSDSSSPQHTRFPSYPQCASQQPYFPQQNFQMNQYAFNQMALFQLQQQYPFNNFGAFGNTSQKTQQPQTSETDSSPAVKGNGKARVRKPKPKKTTIIRTRWSQEEEKLLAETWIQVSKDTRLGVKQERKTFWQKVVSEYNRHASFKCTKDMITRKWTTLTRDCNKFAGIVAQYERLNGENDSMWVTRCYKSFQEIWGFVFVHYEAWDVLKGNSKWRDTKAVVPGRRVRTVDDVEDQNELFRNDPQPRPVSKRRLSKSNESLSSRKAFKEMVQEEWRQDHAKTIDLINTQLKLKFLAFSTIESGKQHAEMINKMKEKILAKYLT